MSPSKAHRLKLDFFDSRKNLPHRTARKRGESNFLRAFEKVYFERHRQFCIAASEFALQHFGRADLVWIAWNPNGMGEDFSVLALHKQLRRRKLFAFEAKLNDWKKGLQQAFRYRYFADKSVIVMPSDSVGPALANLAQFKELDVGLWGFDKRTEKIEEYFSPNRARALSKDAREEAISLISGKINLCQIRKHLNAVAERV